jgi:H+/gluconate symporter-like permease
VLGIIAGLVIAGLGYVYLIWEAKRSAVKGEGFVPGPRDDMAKATSVDRSKLPQWWLTLIPIVVVLLINFIVPTLVREQDPNGTAYYLGRWDATKTVVVSMIVAAVITLAIFWKRLPKKLNTINAGLLQATPACANVAAVVGFGAVVIATGGIAVAGQAALYSNYMADPATYQAAYDTVTKTVFIANGYTNGGFAEFIRFVYNLDLHAYFKAFIGIELLAGVVGSSSGGLSIGLPVLKGAGVFGGPTGVGGAWVYPAGTTAETFHRLTAIAAGGLDTLPHVGGVFLVLTVYQVTHKETYKQIFVTSVLIPTVIAFLASWLAVIFKF